jgi:hypothetical protein
MRHNVPVPLVHVRHGQHHIVRNTPNVGSDGHCHRELAQKKSSKAKGGGQVYVPVKEGGTPCLGETKTPWKLRAGQALLAANHPI